MGDLWEPLRRPATPEERGLLWTIAVILAGGAFLGVAAQEWLSHFLSVLILLPFLGAVALALLREASEEDGRRFALGVALVNLAFSLPLWWAYVPMASPSRPVFAFEDSIEWIPSLGITYHVGVDGVSLLLVLLTTFLSVIVILASWTAITERVREFLIALLVLEGAMIGVFVALDLFLFYVFWELMLIPMYFLIGLWGHERRIYATMKFVLFTMFGSLLMLVALIALYLLSGGRSFDYYHFLAQSFPVRTQLLLFLGFGLAFAVKVPMWPFHTWLPDAHVEAPTAGSVILAGILLKMGTYGFYRFCLPLFPEAAVVAMPFILILALVGILYGALVSTLQADVKKLVAFSSVSHLGFVMLGLFAFDTVAMQGSVLQMVNHGLTTGALFLIVGMLYERRHTRLIAAFGGLWQQTPVLSRLFLIVALASIGLPGLNGFVGEALILFGTFRAKAWAAALAVLGIVLGAIYMLWMYQRVCYGPVDKPENRALPDVNRRELWGVLVPMVALMFYIGLRPTPFLEKVEASVVYTVQRVEAAQRALSSESEGRLAFREAHPQPEGERLWNWWPLRQ